MEVSGRKPMIDTVINLLFNCPHRHLTRPFTPVSHAGVVHGETYVVCLDCAKQFAYDFETMRIGKAIERTHAHSVVGLKMPATRKTKLKYALAGVGLPLAVAIGAMLAGRKPKQQGKADDRAAHL
jgi:hypothetical protein